MPPGTWCWAQTPANLPTLSEWYTSAPGVGPYLMHPEVSLSWLECGCSSCLITKMLCQTLTGYVLIVGQLVAVSDQVLTTSVSTSGSLLSYKCLCFHNFFQADFFVSEVSVISQLLFNPVDGSLLLQHKQFGANVIPDSFGWLDSLMLFTLAFLSLQVLLSRPSVKGGPWKHSHTIQLKRNIYRMCLESFWLVFSYGQMETLVLKMSIQILKGECECYGNFHPVIALSCTCPCLFVCWHSSSFFP